MKLSHLFPDHGKTNDPEVLDLAYDSRAVTPGTLFFAIRGFTVDGTRFVEPALQAGAVTAVVENLTAVPVHLRDRCIAVQSVRKALALASAEFFRHPTESLLTVGVTGTKGKTSTAFLIDSIFSAAGLKPALLGTVVCRHPAAERPAKRTTAESYDLQKFLREAVDAGAKSAVLEVSSHALVLDRTLGCAFDGMVFTNLAEDHLDFHRTMDEYYAAKKILFTGFAEKKSGKIPVAAICIDDRHGKKLFVESSARNVSFGADPTANFRFTNETLSIDGISGAVSGLNGIQVKIKSPLVGEFSKRNILGAVAIAAELGVRPEAIEKGIAAMSGVSGRIERVPSTLPFQVFVDFAHMGAALENVLNALRPICAGRLIVVFGAGGDRDPARRDQLGRVAARLADFSVITSDNPRTESPQNIIAAIEAAYLSERGSGDRNYVIETDRRAAIRIALKMAAPGDVICLAGKGHETGQEVNGMVHPFDDRIEAAKILREIEVDTP